MKTGIIAKCLAAVMALQLLPHAYASAAKQTVISYSPIGAVKNTPPENLFSVDDSGRKFILLDNGGGGDSKYFVLAYDSYAAAQFDPDAYQKFDPEDKNNVAYIMNRALMGTEEYKGYDKLPEAMIKSVNKNQSWSIDAGYEFADGSVTCPLGLLSAGEYMKYMGRFGIVDKIDTQSSRPGWWLRSARGYDANKGHVIMVHTANAQLGATISWDSYGVLAVRPCFYLDSGFFAENKLNVKGMGSNIKKEILKSCDDSALKTLGYSDEEIGQLHDGTDIIERVSLVMPEDGAPWYTKNQLDITAVIDYSGKADKTYKVEFYIDGLKKYENNVFVKANSTQRLPISTGELNNNKHTAELVVSDANEEVGRVNKTFHVLTGYKKTFMEKYTKHGFNHHLRLASYVSGMENELSALERMGVLTVRDGVQWNGIESKFKKKYDFSAFEPWMQRRLKTENSTMVFDFAFNNDLYSGIDGTKVNESVKYTPTTKNEYDNFAEMANAVLKKYPDIGYAQIWNEPLGAGFWKPGWDVPSYANLLGVSGAYIRAQHPDTSIIAGSTGKAHIEFLEDIVNAGAYPYFDSFSIHPYVYPRRAEVLAGELPIDNYLKRNMGGWKTMCSTEFGWPTHVGTNGSSEEQEAAQLVEQFVIFDQKRYELATAYQFSNFGTSAGDREQNFGIITNNRTPKKAAYSVSKFINDMSGAVYIGKLYNDKVNLHFYYKDGEPVAIAWAKDGSETFNPGVNFTARDMYNTPVKVTNGSVTVNETPLYINGLPKRFLAQAAVDSINAEAELFLDSYAVLTGVTPEFGTRERYDDTEVYDKYLANAEDGADGYELIKTGLEAELDGINRLVSGGMLGESETKAALESFYALGNQYIDAYKNGGIKMSQRSFFGLLFSLNWMGETLANLYMTAVEPGSAFQAPESGRKIERLSAQMQRDEDKVVGGKYEMSGSMLRFIKRYADMAADAATDRQNSRSRSGVVKSRELLCGELIGWFENIQPAEEISHTALMLQMTRANRKFYNFAENTATFSLYNFGKKDFAGQIRMFDADGSELVVMDAALKAGESGEFSKDFILQNETADASRYTIRLTEGDETLLEQVIDDVALKGKSDIKMKPVDKTLDELEEISFEITNTFNKELTFTVKAEAPEGWTLEKDTADVTIKSGASGTVSFRVTGAKRTEFNEYYFSAKAYEGDTQVASLLNTPLNFTVVTPASEKIDVDGFDADVSSWKTAYPVMVAAPANPQLAESWDNSTMSMRAYARYDSENLYIMARVNDETHLNRQTGVTIWNGDALQISIDGANDKTAKYSAGDYEYGFALTDYGLESECWYGQNAAFDDISFNIVHKPEERMTYYLIKLPKAAVSPLELSSGSAVGMNLVIADADYISRDIFEELTDGTAYTKSPISYYSWRLTGKE